MSDLKAFFQPRCVALVTTGSLEDPVVVALIRNLFAEEGGTNTELHRFLVIDTPSGPDTQAVPGLPGEIAPYADLADLPRRPDLVVLAGEHRDLERFIVSAADCGIPAALTFQTCSAGVAISPERAVALARFGRKRGVRVLGPNSFGMMLPRFGLNASLGTAMPPAGRLAVVTQSGGILSSLADWCAPRGIGFTHMICVGEAADVGYEEVLDHLTADFQTSGILLHFQRIREARHFMSAARAASRTKPVATIRAGYHRDEVTAFEGQAVISEDAIYHAAIRRAGMIRVSTLDNLLEAVQTLDSRPRLTGESLTIVTNGWGVGELALDGLVREGGRPHPLSEDLQVKLQDLPVSAFPKIGLVDLGEEANGALYAAALEAVLNDKETHAVLVLHCPTIISKSMDVAEAILATTKQVRRKRGSLKPVFTCWVGEAEARPARIFLDQHHISTYETPGTAVRAFMDISRHARNQRLLMETPPKTQSVGQATRARATAILQTALETGRRELTTAESEELLTLYGLPVLRSRIAETPAEAAAAARLTGFPVALKILSSSVHHRSSVGGIRLNLETEEAVLASARELIDRFSDPARGVSVEGLAVQPMVSKPGGTEVFLGMRDDPVFGPVVAFGRGGTGFSVAPDISVALPPLNRILVFDLMSRTRLFRTLEGEPGRPPADRGAIAEAILKIGEMAADLADLAEISINPLVVDHAGAVVIDSEIIVARSDVPGHDRFAIRPYPRELEASLEDKHGAPYTIRPIRPDDEPLLQELISACDAEDIRLRFFTAFQKLPDKLAARLTQIDYDREMAFVLEREGRLAGVVRLSTLYTGEDAEYAVLVRSDLKGLGLGWRLMKHIIAYGRTQPLNRIIGEVLSENEAMIGMCLALGFEKHTVPDDTSLVKMVLVLDRPGPSEA